MSEKAEGKNHYTECSSFNYQSTFIPNLQKLSLYTNQRSGTADQRSFKRALNNCHHVKLTAAGKNESEMENPLCSLCKIQSFKQITNSCF